MRKISLLLIMMIASLLLVGCGNKEGLTKKERETIVTVKNIEPFLRKVEIELEIDDPNDKLVNKTLLLKVLEEDEQVFKTEIKINEREDENDKEPYIIEQIVKGLKEKQQYRLEITASLNVRNKITKYALVDQTFDTLAVGRSEEDPIIVRTIEDFMKIGREEDTANVYYKLANDLDFANYQEGIYDHQFETRRFQGTFDGNNQTIKNFEIDKRTTTIGLFPYNSGTIKNLNVDNAFINLIDSNDYSQYIGIVSGRNTGTIENINVTNSNVKLGFNYTGKVYTGGVVGKSESSSTLNNLSAKVNFEVTSVSRSEFVLGSIVGHLHKSTLDGAAGEATITIENADTNNIGGIVGFSEDSKVFNSTFKGSITMETIVRNISLNEKIEIIVGGAIGLQIDSTIENIYVNSEVTLTDAVNNANNQSDKDKIYIGGFIGKSATPKATDEVLIDTVIIVGKELGEEEEEKVLFSGFEEISIGGAIGQHTVNPKHNNIFVFEPEITVYSGNGNYYISPVSGVIQENINIDFKGGSITLNEVVYTNKTLKWYDVKVEIDDEIETVKQLVEYDLEEEIFNGYFEEDSFVLEERAKLNN